MILVKHPEGGTMMVPDKIDVRVSRRLPSSRVHTDDVPAEQLAAYLARRPGGTEWEFVGIGGKIRMKGGKR